MSTLKSASEIFWPLAIFTKLNNFFFSSNFDVVIVTNYPKDVALKVNNFCRDLKIKFFAGDIFGYFGYSFMDLVKHDYVEEEVKKVEAGEGKKPKEDQPDAKKAKMVRFLTILDDFILLNLQCTPGVLFETGQKIEKLWNEFGPSK